MERLGFKPILECACLYINGRIVVFFYVDDIVIMVHPKYYSDFLDFKAKLIAAYEMRDIGELKWFLGIRVTRDRLRRRIWLSQDLYIRKICA
jgi:Reverse transcriptase (RNA-dependent DNA polymerase)